MRFHHVAFWGEGVVFPVDRYGYDWQIGDVLACDFLWQEALYLVNHFLFAQYSVDVVVENGLEVFDVNDVAPD